MSNRERNSLNYHINYLNICPPANDKLNEVIDACQWYVSSSKEKKTFIKRFVTWYVKHFLRYTFDAVFRGWPIKINKKITIAITYEPVRTLDKFEKKRYVISDRVFGYMFCLTMYGPLLKNYEWYPDEFLMTRLRLLVDSDEVYKLIKHEKK